MRTKMFSLLLIFCLLGLMISAVSFVSAQERLYITIALDGHVEPITDLLERKGNVYTFKSDIYGTLEVHGDNVIIDGAGYTLNDGGILLGTVSQAPQDCTGVVIKNLKMTNGTLLAHGGFSHVFTGNYFENVDIVFPAGNPAPDADVDDSDIFSHNTFVNVRFNFSYAGGSLIILTNNNVVNVGMVGFGTYYPKLDGNYYGDYTMRYPKAKPLDNNDDDGVVGVWDTPYALPVEDAGSTGVSTVDNRPLVNPVTGFEVPQFNEPLPPAKTPQSNTSGSSSSGGSIKMQTTNKNADLTLQPVKPDVSSADVASDNVVDSVAEQTSTTPDFGLITITAIILTTIAAAILVIKKGTKT